MAAVKQKEIGIGKQLENKEILTGYVGACLQAG
jgi:hypothetical protein